MFWSPSTSGFYDAASAARPGDCVALSAEQYQLALLAQGAGKRITVGADGLISVIDAPPVPDLVSGIEKIELAYGTEASTHGLLRYLVALALKPRLSAAEKTDAAAFVEAADWEAAARATIATGADAIPEPPAALSALLARF